MLFYISYDYCYLLIIAVIFVRDRPLLGAFWANNNNNDNNDHDDDDGGKKIIIISARGGRFEKQNIDSFSFPRVVTIIRFRDHTAADDEGFGFSIYDSAARRRPRCIMPPRNRRESFYFFFFFLLDIGENHNVLVTASTIPKISSPACPAGFRDCVSIMRQRPELLIYDRLFVRDLFLNVHFNHRVLRTDSNTRFQSQSYWVAPIFHAIVGLRFLRFLT